MDLREIMLKNFFIKVADGNIGALTCCMELIETRRVGSFDDTVEMMKGLNSIMGYHVEGKIDGKNL